MQIPEPFISVSVNKSPQLPINFQVPINPSKFLKFSMLGFVGIEFEGYAT